MIPVFSFDPASMTMWFDPTIISKNGDKEYLSEVLNNGLNGHIDDSLIALITKAPNDWELKRALELLSCIWHEQKHFFDFTLTSYGAFRVRQFFEIYINLEVVLESYLNENAEITFPLDCALDPIRKKILNIYSNEIVEKFGKSILKRKNYAKTDRYAITLNNKKFEIGGEAQLEALAYLTQLIAIQEFCGGRASLDLQKLTPKSMRAHQKYNWFIEIGQHFGLLTHIKFDDQSYLIDTSFILPILYASLFSRNWNDPKGSKMDMPSFRFVYLMKEIAKEKDNYLKLDLEGKWNYVNKLTKSKWGKTVLEEFEFDLKEEEKMVNQIQEISYLYNEVKITYKEYHENRKKVLKIFKENPLSIIDPKLFVNEYLDKMTPIPVVAYPHGITNDMPDWKSVFGYHEGEDNWIWGVMPKKWIEDEKSFSMFKISDWSFIVSYLAPIAKLILNGRSHKTMLGPELLVAQKVLEKNNWKIKFDPLFEFPEEKNLMPFFHYLTNNNDSKCDICNSDISYPNGRTISPWVFRYSIMNGTFGIKILGDEEIGRSNFIKDWSMWIVCESCHDNVRNNLDWRD